MGEWQIMKDEIIVEYGQLDLKQILSDYLKQKFIERLNEEA